MNKLVLILLLVFSPFTLAGDKELTASCPFTVKAGVEFSTLDPHLYQLVHMMACTFPHVIGKNLVITSITEGRHVANSLHHLGLAIDVRTRDTTRGMMLKIIAALRPSFPEFIFILKSDHLHIQWDGLLSSNLIPEVEANNSSN